MKNKKTISAVAVLLVLVIGAILAYVFLRPASQVQKAPDGSVRIEVQVVHGDESTKDFTIVTTAETLRAALEQENLVQGDEGEYGLYVKTVDGETADEAQQQWWAFSKGGEMLMTGVDSTEISDGDHYEITLTTGW